MWQVLWGLLVSEHRASLRSPVPGCGWHWETSLSQTAKLSQGPTGVFSEHGSRVDLPTWDSCSVAAAEDIQIMIPLSNMLWKYLFPLFLDRAIYTEQPCTAVYEQTMYIKILKSKSTASWRDKVSWWHLIHWTQLMSTNTQIWNPSKRLSAAALLSKSILFALPCGFYSSCRSRVFYSHRG